MMRNFLSLRLSEKNGGDGQTSGQSQPQTEDAEAGAEAHVGAAFEGQSTTGALAVVDPRVDFAVSAAQHDARVAVACEHAHVGEGSLRSSHREKTCVVCQCTRRDSLHRPQQVAPLTVRHLIGHQNASTPCKVLNKHLKQLIL